MSSKFSFKDFFANILDGFIGCITPLIPMFIGGGMIKVIALIVNLAGVPADNTTYMILTWVGDAFIYFMPIFLGATAAKKFGANQGLGMLLGGVLMAKGYMDAVAAGTSLNFLGLPVYSGNYTSTVVPIILSVWVLSKIEPLVSKYSPKSLRTTLVPTISLLIVVPIMLVVTAPLGFYIGKYVSAAVIWLYNNFGFLGLAILAGFKPLLVMTGMHLGMIPVVINNFAVLGFDPFYIPAGFISNLNQTTACLAVGLKTKNKDLRSVAFSSAFTAFLSGVTEPAMYSVTIKYKKPMTAAIIGGIVGGALLGILGNVASYVMPGNMGILSIPVFIGGDGSGLRNLLIASVAGMVVTFAATWILGFEDEEESEAISNV